MAKNYNGFEGLEIYQAARAFRTKVSSLSKKFPANEQFVLKKQLLRSARSISANIAEGYGRYHFQEFLQFCRIARGSLHESLDHLICAFDEGYLSQQEMDDARSDFKNILRLLNGFMNYLNKQKTNTTFEKTNTTNTTSTTNTTNTHA